MEFVEEYLRDVVGQRFPFSDKEKNKLTFEVMIMLYDFCRGDGGGGFPIVTRVVF